MIWRYVNRKDFRAEAAATRPLDFSLAHPTSKCERFGRPSSVTVPAGSDRTSFTVTTAPVSSSINVTLSANYNGTWASTTLTVTATGRSGERVTSSPAGIDVAVGTTGSASFTTGTSITLSVTNGRDAIWSGGCSSGGEKTRTCTFTLNADASVTANVQ